MFPKDAPSANPVFYRTYSRVGPNGKESWEQVVDRCVAGLAKVGKFDAKEEALVREEMLALRALPSGRWLWVGGTPWIEDPKNFSGAYNCTSTHLVDIKSFSLQMALLMMGSGTGAVIEPYTYGELPVIRNRTDLKVVGEIGSSPSVEHTEVEMLSDGWHITIGDSREGWCAGVYWLLRLATIKRESAPVTIDISHVRAPGARIAGFGGVANPVRLAKTYERLGEILDGAVGRQLSSVECCLILDECSLAVVAGNVRRSAGMRQFDSGDAEAATAKDNLWSVGEDGKWRIDPKRDALRMANHTRVFHTKPSLDDIKLSVEKQYRSGEGAIQFAPEAIARANADVLDTPNQKAAFLTLYENDPLTAAQYLEKLGADNVQHRMQRYGLNPCGEIIGKDFHCNLAEVHLNLLDPHDYKAQQDAFRAAALSACALLHHQFMEPRYQFSREIDPIIGVSFTGLFDFFVLLFGAPWLEWWSQGRPSNPYYEMVEAQYLANWKVYVEDTVKDYCTKHGLRVPNRTTTVQPAGTKSLLTGASPGWHPPKAARFIRRITFGKNDPVALACEAYGYKIIPSQSDRDETGALLEDPRDPRCTEWLVEIPTKTVWADEEGCDQYDISKFSAKAQLSFYMQVQEYYTTHNTSATIEFRESEIEELAEAIHGNIGKGYISAALLARFDSKETFPRLPFEPIDEVTYGKLSYEVSQRQITADFGLALSAYAPSGDEQGPAACDSDKCLFAEKKG